MFQHIFTPSKKSKCPRQAAPCKTAPWWADRGSYRTTLALLDIHSRQIQQEVKVQPEIFFFHASSKGCCRLLTVGLPYCFFSLPLYQPSHDLESSARTMTLALCQSKLRPPPLATILVSNLTLPHLSPTSLSLSLSFSLCLSLSHSLTHSLSVCVSLSLSLIDFGHFAR